MNKNREAEQLLEIFHAIDFEKIKDHPNILIAAAFWDRERYQAACTAYRFMRSIDDLIDDHKSEHSCIGKEEQTAFTENVRLWTARIKTKEPGSIKESLTETWNKFLIPVWVIDAFAGAMTYDIHHEGFNTFKTFLEYAEGASVAPAGIFVHLCGLREADGKYLPPVFDVREVARPCAIFSYLVHIIRDFQKDRLNHLNYFPADLLDKYSITPAMLDSMAHGAPPAEEFRNLVRFYIHEADKHRLETLRMIEHVSPLLSIRYRLSLRIIFDLYLMVYNRIDPEKGSFTTEVLQPSAQDIKQQVGMTLSSFFQSP